MNPVAIPFYTRANFIKIASLLPHSDWPSTYEDWLSKTETAERGVKKSGNIPVRINIEPATFKTWCKANNQPIARESIIPFCCQLLLSQSGNN